jgi:hypothetical protein
VPSLKLIIEKFIYENLKEFKANLGNIIKELAMELKRNPESQVGNDIINTISIFSHVSL